jgi:hypothetical protein
VTVVLDVGQAIEQVEHDQAEAWHETELARRRRRDYASSSTARADASAGRVHRVCSPVPTGAGVARLARLDVWRLLRAIGEDD